ncbi:hypothetical protein HMPREF9711_02082 [Myroides odoratimimus CCUG 3837]|nr:hypothetical protein HMPREF9711_02082 [Myroides odoratimimus CCUG 3837]
MDIVKIVSEFKADVPGIKGGVKCRIEKSLRVGDSCPYSFVLSYYFSGTKDAGIYYPTSEYETYETAKEMLFAYLKGFSDCFKVEKNLEY